MGWKATWSGAVLVNVLLVSGCSGGDMGHPGFGDDAEAPSGPGEAGAPADAGADATPGRGDASPAPVDAGGADAAADAVADAKTEASGALHYDATIGPILDGSCTTVCHGACGGLMISYANILNVATNEDPSLDYVTPGDPGHSYLFCKISPTDAACKSAGTTITGTQMPPFGMLSAGNIALVKTWIQQGALQ